MATWEDLVGDGAPALQPALKTDSNLMSGPYLGQIHAVAMDDATGILSFSETGDPNRHYDRVRMVFTDGTLGSIDGGAGDVEPTDTTFIDTISQYGAVGCSLVARGGTLWLMQALYFSGAASLMLRRYPLPDGPIELLANYTTTAARSPLAVDSGGGVAFTIGFNLLYAPDGSWTSPTTLSAFAGVPCGMDYDGSDVLWLLTREAGVGVHLYRYDGAMSLVATVAASWGTPAAYPGDVAALADGPLATTRIAGVGGAAIDRDRGALYFLDVPLAVPWTSYIPSFYSLPPPGALRLLDLDSLAVSTVCGGAAPFTAGWENAPRFLTSDLLPGAGRDPSSLARFIGGRSVTVGTDGAVYWSQGAFQSTYPLAPDTFYKRYSVVYRTTRP